MKTTAKFTALRNLAAISTGHPMRGSVDGLESGEVCLIQMRDIFEDATIAWSNALRIAPPGKRPPNYLRAGDIILTTRGHKNVAVMVPERAPQAICAPNLFIIRIDNVRVCSPEFVCWYLNQSPAQAYLKKSATGTNILNIRREVVEQLPLAVPPLASQKYIVEFDQAARAERLILRRLLNNRETQMEALALSLAECGEV